MGQLYFIWNCITFSGNLVHESPPSEFISQNNPCQSDINHGLYSNITQSLPITIFKNKNEKEFKPRNNECAVCLNEYEEGESLKHLPRCSHMFHAACIDSWFKYHLYCPLDRSQIFNPTCHDQSSLTCTGTLLDTLMREEFVRERAEIYMMIRTRILQNLASMPQETGPRLDSTSSH